MADIISFGDGSHAPGATGLAIAGAGFLAFPGSVWIYENANRTGAADELTINSWSDLAINVDVPGSLNNPAGMRYLFVQTEDLNWSFPLGFTLESGGAEDITPPLLLSARVAYDGDSITLRFDEPVTIGAGGNAGFALTASGGAATLTYVSGDGTDSLIYSTSRTLADSETVTIDYTQPGDGVEDLAGNDLESFSDESVGFVPPPGDQEFLVAPRLSFGLRLGF